jgi:hypothetical protein
MEGRYIMAQEIMGQAKFSPDIFSEKNRLQYVIEWCEMELKRIEPIEKSATDIRHERQYQERDDYDRRCQR